MSVQSTEKLDSLETKIMKTPRGVDIEITSRCNLRCKYCYYYDNPDVNYYDLPKEEWLKFFNELGKCAVMDVTLAGGEPFIRKDLPIILEGIVNNRMRFSILSNGTLIDDKIADFITNTGRCNYVQVSIDGSSPKTHDSCRGKGSFDKAVHGIEILQKYKIPVAVRVTIHRYNVYDLENIAKFLLEDLGLSSFGTNSAGYLGSCRINANEVLLNIKERQFAMKTLKKLSEKYKGRISATAGPLAEVKMWHEMERARKQKDPPFSYGGYLTGCGGTNSKIAIRADGVITPCNMLPHMELGRINKDSLIDVWQKNPILNNFRQRHKISLKDFEFCNGCPYIPYCTGNCPGLAYTLTGKVNHPSPDACLWRFIKNGGKII